MQLRAQPAALAPRPGGSETFYWAVIVPFTLSAIVGDLARQAARGQLPQRPPPQAFVGLLPAVTVYIAIRTERMKLSARSAEGLLDAYWRVAN